MTDTQNNEVVTIQANDLLIPDIMFEEDANAGFENTTNKDFGLPILRVLQSLSPEIDAENERFMKGAQAGDIFNVATKEIFKGKKGITLIPITFFRRYVEYVPRDQGGGFVAEHEKLSAEAQQLSYGKWFNEEKGTEIIETGYFPSLLCKEHNRVEQVVLLISSSFWRFAREWLTLMKTHVRHDKNNNPYILPFFSHIYHISTKSEKNSKGTWKIFQLISHNQITDPVLYQQARILNKQLKEEGVKIQHEEDTFLNNDEVF